MGWVAAGWTSFLYLGTWMSPTCLLAGLSVALTAKALASKFYPDHLLLLFWFPGGFCEESALIWEAANLTMCLAQQKRHKNSTWRYTFRNKCTF